MHALRRPRLPRAIAVTATAAVLAIVLTLAFTSAVRDLRSAPAPASAPSRPAAAPVSATSDQSNASPFTRSPFSSLLSAPVAPPWAKYVHGKT
jgi:hypothetical protein